MIWYTVLTSAVVGALAAQAVTLLGQALERRQKEREIVFRCALEVARERREHVSAAADASAGVYMDRDPLWVAAEYYPIARHLFRKGCLPKDAPLERMQY